jgi:hypothetical protein
LFLTEFNDPAKELFLGGAGRLSIGRDWHLHKKRAREIG